MNATTSSSLIGIAVHRDALAEVDEVRRGVESHAQAARAQERVERRDDAPLAVGAGDVERRA